MDVLVQTVRNEGVLGLYKGSWAIDAIQSVRADTQPHQFLHVSLHFMALPCALSPIYGCVNACVGMASPLLGIAAVNSLLFAAYNVSKRAINPFHEHTLPQIALAGSMAGAANSILASPGEHGSIHFIHLHNVVYSWWRIIVELFKIRMQGQYGGVTDKRLSRVFLDTWRNAGLRHGVMRGFWATLAREIPAYAG
jgi:hypothetical protein